MKIVSDYCRTIRLVVNFQTFKEALLTVVVMPTESDSGIFIHGILIKVNLQMKILDIFTKVSSIQQKIGPSRS